MKYQNLGQYNKTIVETTAQQYCATRGINYQEGVTYKTNDFLDFILTLTLEWATGDSVKRFLEVYKANRVKKGFHPDDASENLLETFTNIHKAKMNKWKRKADKINTKSL